MYVRRFLIPMQMCRHNILFAEQVGKVFQVVGTPFIQFSIPFDALHILVCSRYVDADYSHLVASDFPCQSCFLQSTLDSRRTVFHSIGVVDELLVKVRARRVSVLRYDETLDVGGRSAVETMRLFHVQYYKSHIFSLSFLACETMVGYSSVRLLLLASESPERCNCFGLLGNFQRCLQCGLENSLISYDIFH